MKVLLVSTIGHNPGDDFIRWGQEHLLRQLRQDSEFVVVHKHDPRTLFTDFTHSGSSPHRLLSPLLYRIHRWRTRARNRLEDADLVVFAGTPFIWRHDTRIFRSSSANAEWVGPTWRSLMEGGLDTPVFNLAAGTSLNAGQTADSILGDPRLVDFLKAAVQRSALVTARDDITASIVARLGREIRVLPCTSLWAAAGAGLEPQAAEYVAVNVMRRSVHVSRGKRAPSSGWRNTIQEVVAWLSTRHEVRLVCHSPGELQTARAWFPERDAFYSEDPMAILDAYGRALYTVSNRVHGAAGAASYCRPALGIGGDSRMRLLNEFGLPALDAQTATSKEIIAECVRIERDYTSITEQLTGISLEGADTYTELLRSHLPS